MVPCFALHLPKCRFVYLVLETIQLAGGVVICLLLAGCTDEGYRCVVAGTFLYYTVIAPVLEKQAGLTTVRYNESFSKINCQR